MCLAYRHTLDPKTRRIRAAALFLLAASNLLFVAGQPLAHRYPDAVEALRGFLLGLAIVFLAWSYRRNHRCAQSHA